MADKFTDSNKIIVILIKQIMKQEFCQHLSSSRSLPKAERVIKPLKVLKKILLALTKLTTTLEAPNT